MTATAFDIGPILALPIDERVEIASRIQQSIEAENEAFELTDAMKEELERRVNYSKAHPEENVPWETVYAELMERLER